MPIDWNLKELLGTMGCLNNCNMGDLTWYKPLHFILDVGIKD